MPAKTGQQYIEGLRANPAEVWIRGERVKDVTTHPALAGGVGSVAALYDLQHDEAAREEMLFASPSSGDPVGMSFKVPRTAEDLIRRRAMMTRWAWVGCGMMARTPDFLNVSIAAWAGAAEYFGQNRPEFADNVQNYYEFIRENDTTLTHTLVNLQPRRTSGTVDDLDDQVALTVVKETDAGIVVRGSRVLATLGPISDEIAVYPTRTHMIGPDAWRQALFFSIPCATPGVKFICRESFDYGRSGFDHPLGSRFEEMDAIVFFDDVLVPWERVFLLGDVDMCNNYGHRHPVHHTLRIPGGEPVRSQDRVHPGAGPDDGGHAGIGGPDAHPGKDRGDNRPPGDAEGLHAGLGGRRVGQRLRGDVPGAGADHGGAGTLPHDNLSKAVGDSAATGVGQPDGPAVGGGLRRSHRPGG